jgi:adenine-specific DNA-methyltransferase
MKPELGQVWTPADMVDHMLDGLHYGGKSILHRRIMEPSCGQGVFIIHAVERLHHAGRESGMSAGEISAMLDECIYGVEYDGDTYDVCMDNICSYARSLGLDSTFPHVIRHDALTLDYTGVFDFIVGNPPYIRVHHMNEDMRALVKGMDFCTGTTDAYIAFFDMCLRWLNSDGVLSFIAPSSWISNVSQRHMRDYLIEHGSIISIDDYTHVNVFRQGTYTAVVNLRSIGGRHGGSFDYSCMSGINEASYTKSIPYKDMGDGASWPVVFSNMSLATVGDKLSEFYDVRNGFATLLDKAFVINDEDFIHRNDRCPYLIPVVKSSRYDGSDIHARILFPYHRKNGSYVPITLHELQSWAEVYEHIKGYMPSLLKRHVDTDVPWYCYGRSQSIQQIDEEKLSISTIVPPYGQCAAYHLQKGVAVYSGLYLTEKHPYDGTHDIEYVRNVLQSEEFADYARIVSAPMSGGYHRIGTPAIKDFIISER